MQELKDYTFRTGGGRYDWDTILNGKIYRLTAGEDFDCVPKSFNLMVRSQAKRRGGKARVSEEKNEAGEVTSVVVQYIEVEG